MRDAARALDDVSDHLGEVLRRADDLLAEWSRFGTAVRAQVEREAAAVGDVVEGAIGRAATAGIDRAIGDRLHALTVELERLEQRTRAASRAVVEQREADRRLLWAMVAGIVLANVLLAVLVLRRPQMAPGAEPIRMDAPVTQPAPAAQEAAPAANGAANEGSAAPGSGAATAGSNAAAGVAADAITGGGPPGAQGSAAAPTAGAKASLGSGAAHPAEPAAPKPSPPSPIDVAPKPGAAHQHKKLP